MQRLTNLSTNTMDDMFLLQLIKNGDKQAFKYVFDTYFTVLCRFMYLYLGDTQEAEDIASDIFATVWENRKKLEIRLTFKAYLFQAAKNRCLNAIRDRKATISLDDINGQDTPQVSITDSLETEELNNLIQEAILSLPEKDSRGTNHKSAETNPEVLGYTISIFVLSFPADKRWNDPTSFPPDKPLI